MSALLLELRVESLGIIDELTLVFADGLTAVTGETGAGKTLVITALELLAGGRADPGRVRDGAAEARVEARFVDAAGEEVVLTRVVPVDGRSRAYVNGRLATAGELAELAARLVDLHGQHAHQAFLEPAAQRHALDAFAGAPALEALARYRAARAEVRAVDEALAALGGDARARAREVDLLRFQLEELEAAGLGDPDEHLALEAEEELLAHAEAHREALSAAYTDLEGPAVDAAGRAAAVLAGREPFAALEARARGLQAELAELAHDVRAARDEVVANPARLDAVRSRRRLLRELGRKYGDTPRDMLAFGSEAAARLEELLAHDERASALEQERAAALSAADAAAAQLSAARTAAADALAEAVAERLRRLAMPNARLAVEVTPAEPNEDGADRVTFLLAANPGEPLRPLAKAASGGELSRAVLALRVALQGPAVAAAGPVLVFDEVDAGIGGEAGVAVGRELAALASGSQVLCVTHLAQVAAFADAQVAVRKHGRGSRTVATAELLLGEARVAELSRMLAGVGGSEHARRHAEELLVTAGRGGR